MADTTGWCRRRWRDYLRHRRHPACRLRRRHQLPGLAGGKEDREDRGVRSGQVEQLTHDAIRTNAPTYGGDQKSLFSFAASERSRCVRVSRSPSGSSKIPSFLAMGTRLRMVFASQEYPAKSGPPPTTNSPDNSGSPSPAFTNVCRSSAAMLTRTPAAANV